MPMPERFTNVAVDRETHRRVRELAETLHASQGLILDAAVARFEALSERQQQQGITDAAERLSLPRRIMRQTR